MKWCEVYLDLSYERRIDASSHQLNKKEQITLFDRRFLPKRAAGHVQDPFRNIDKGAAEETGKVI